MTNHEIAESILLKSGRSWTKFERRFIVEYFFVELKFWQKGVIYLVRKGLEKEKSEDVIQGLAKEILEKGCSFEPNRKLGHVQSEKFKAYLRSRFWWFYIDYYDKDLPKEQKQMSTEEYSTSHDNENSPQKELEDKNNPNPEQIVLQKECFEALQDCLKELSEKQHEAILLGVATEFNYDEMLILTEHLEISKEELLQLRESNESINKIKYGALNVLMRVRVHNGRKNLLKCLEKKGFHR